MLPTSMFIIFSLVVFRKHVTNINVYHFQAVEGKIVVYNEPYISYEKTVKYRGYGAIEAAKLGAVATLIRSVTPFSIDSPVSKDLSCHLPVKPINICHLMIYSTLDGNTTRRT
jgi:hypothetical protein